FGETYIGVWRTGDYKILISRVSDPDKLDIVDRTPIEEQVLDQQVYRVLSDKLQNKQLYFDSPELRLIAEKHLRKYIYNSASEWETF
ncbi:DNA encapsidation protein, partial [Enterococcus faecalis]|nr:DNA encapsidation protein [Enterococcus faecalis]